MLDEDRYLVFPPLRSRRALVRGLLKVLHGKNRPVNFFTNRTGKSLVMNNSSTGTML